MAKAAAIKQDRETISAPPRDGWSECARCERHLELEQGTFTKDGRLVCADCRGAAAKRGQLARWEGRR